jgi:putative phage-type endonuclease
VTARRLAPASLEDTDRDAWLELRRGGIGGSDAPSIMGMDGYSSAWRVWLDKVVGPQDTFTEDELEAMEFGHEMEALIARRWARRHAVPGRLARCGMLAHPEHPWMRVNLDRRVSDCGLGRGPCILECKHRSAFQGGKWSRTGDPEDIPDGPPIQVQHALMITGYSHGHLAAELGHQLRSYVIEADQRLQKTLLEEESWFWHDHVLTRVPPPIDGSERTGRILDTLWGAEPGKILAADGDLAGLVASLRAARGAADELAAVADRQENELKQAMGEHEILTGADGRPLATWKRNGPFRSSAYLADHPDSPYRHQVALSDRQVTLTDTAALAAADEGTYRSYRARVLRLPARKD